MTFTHALSTNNYGPFKFVVATSAANGTHTTLASAMSAASSGDTIFLRDSVTENVTLTPGVNIVGPTGQIGTNQPTITGKLTMTGAGTCIVENICLTTNSDFVIAVTGSAASILNVNNCYINCTNNTGISHTTTGAGSIVSFANCFGDIGTTGISIYTSTSTQVLNFYSCTFTNSGSSTTASTCSGGGAAGLVSHENSFFKTPFSTSSTGSLFFQYCTITLVNTTAITTAGTSSTNEIRWCNIATGSAIAISIGSGTTAEIINNRLVSSNTNVVTGAGQVLFGPNTYAGSSLGVNTSTITDETVYAGILKLHTPLSVANGGTGATTLTGIVTGNGTSAMTANTVTQHGVLIGGASNAASSLGVASTGTVLAGATGADPAFTATPSVTSITLSSGTALSTYVQGTFTTGVAFGGGTTGITYSTQIGQYTQIGNVIYFTIVLVLSNKGSSTGAATITGFPVSNGGQTCQIIITQFANLTLSASNTYAYITTSAGTAFAVNQFNPSTGTGAALSNTAFVNNTNLQFQGFYYTS